MYPCRKTCLWVFTTYCSVCTDTDRHICQSKCVGDCNTLQSMYILTLAQTHLPVSLMCRAPTKKMWKSLKTRGVRGHAPPLPRKFFYVNPQNSPFPWIWDPFSWTLNPFFKVFQLLQVIRKCSQTTTIVANLNTAQVTVRFTGFLQLTEASIQSHPFHFLVKPCPAPFVFTTYVDFFA